MKVTGSILLSLINYFSLCINFVVILIGLSLIRSEHKYLMMGVKPFFEIKPGKIGQLRLINLYEENIVLLKMGAEDSM